MADLAGYLEAPPRTVGPQLAAQMILGNATTQVGCLIFAIGSLFFWLFPAHADLSGWRFRQGSVAKVTGTSTGCTDTQRTAGGGDESRGTPVYENRYRYTVDGTEYAGHSYATGTCIPKGRVAVEYLREHPSYSRLRGMRRNMFSPWVAPVALVPAAGLIVLVAGCRRGRLWVRLLRDGLPAAGLVTDKVPTQAEIMDKVVYRVTLEFTARDGTHSIAARTTQPERFREDKPEPILFDPGDPQRAVAVANLPGGFSHDHAGRILPGASRGYLFLPIVTLVLNSWMAYRNWH